jgi:transcriptional regulator with XRE-family HTH domain
MEMVTDIGRVLSDNLKRLRGIKGWTQADLAEKSGLSFSTIQGYESQRRWPERLFVTALAKAFSVAEIELFAVKERLTPTIEALLHAVDELRKENISLKSSIPENIMELWLAASEQRRRSAIVTLGGKIGVKKKSHLG